MNFSLAALTTNVPVICDVIFFGKEKWKKKTIRNVASVLEAWNPLGEAANTVEGLDGYRVEAIDVISTIGILSGPDKVEQSVAQVLTQAFDIVLNEEALADAAKDISRVLGVPN